MGTFARLIGKCNIPDNRKNIVKERLKLIFKLGGMATTQTQRFLDTELILTKPYDSSKDESFFYNIYEETYWENAGIKPDGISIWSEKVGWYQYKDVVSAAYMLLEQESATPCIAAVWGMPMFVDDDIGWLNYIFNENYTYKTRHPWNICEAIHSEGNDEITASNILKHASVSDEDDEELFYHILDKNTPTSISRG